MPHETQAPAEIPATTALSCCARSRERARASPPRRRGRLHSSPVRTKCEGATGLLPLMRRQLGHPCDAMGVV